MSEAFLYVHPTNGEVRVFKRRDHVEAHARMHGYEAVVLEVEVKAEHKLEKPRPAGAPAPVVPAPAIDSAQLSQILALLQKQGAELELLRAKAHEAPAPK